MLFSRRKAMLVLALAIAVCPLTVISQPSTHQCPELFKTLSHLPIREYRERSQKAYEEFLEEKDPSLYQKKLHRNYSSILPNEDHTEIRGYTEDGYKALNAGLVESFPRAAATLRWRDKIIEELATLPPYVGWVYSGAGLTESEFSSFRAAIGKTKDFSYFFSTSRSKKEASQFLKKQAEKGDDRIAVLFSIKSKTGRNIALLSQFPSEQEVLFPPSSQFRVTSITRLVEDRVLGDRPFWKIELDEVEPKAIKIETVKNPSDYNFDEQIDLKRFGSHGPWLSSEEYNDWKNAYEIYVRSGNNHEISLETLKEIHKKTMGNAFFPGYERRRVRKDYQTGKLNKTEAIEKLIAIDGLKSYTGKKPSSLAGTLRKNPLDSFIYEGDLQDGELHRYVPKEDLEGLLANPYFRLERDSIVKLDDDRYQAKFHYVPPRFVEEEVQNVIRNAARQLSQAKSPEAYVRTALNLNRDLITIHPFLDGNGRTIRLFIDMILAKHNYPLPLTPFEKEYSSSLDSILRQTSSEMNRWLLEKQKR